MVFIKAFLSGLVGVSLCLANISGIVTDTGMTPISGAVVQLEKGGQKATTGADGLFTLVISSAILPGKRILLQSSLSATISGNMLNVTIAERAFVEVASFDLNGKVLSTVQKIFDMGCHSLSLPNRGAGLHLYKLKIGNREILLKGNSVGGTSSGVLTNTQCAIPNSLAKQTRSMSAINEVITAIKADYLNYRCFIGNSDTSEIIIKMIANAGDVTDTDGNVYQSVRIGNQVWTVDNLRVTKYTDGTEIPLDTSTATWSDAMTPKYCFYKNTTDSDSINKFGALYNWYVVNPANPKKIAPTGWHVPRDVEWDTLMNHLISRGYNWDGASTGNKIAKSLSAKTDWDKDSTKGTVGCELTNNNRSGFSALPGGCRTGNSNFGGQSSFGLWWSCSEYDLPYAYSCYLGYDDDFLVRGDSNKSCGFSVRLVRD